MARSWFRRSATLAALGTALALLPTAAFAKGDHSSFHLHVDGDDGDKVDIDLSLGWIATLVDWSDFECDVHTDADTRRMARALDRAGEDSVYRFEDEDGAAVVARRQDGVLKIEKREDHGKLSKVELPWPLAECLFLGREPQGGIGRALKKGDFKIRVEGKDGDRVSIDVD